MTCIPSTARKKGDPLAALFGFVQLIALRVQHTLASQYEVAVAGYTLLFAAYFPVGFTSTQ